MGAEGWKGDRDRLAGLQGMEGSCPVPPCPGTGSVAWLSPRRVPPGVSDSNVQFLKGLVGLLESDATTQVGLGPHGVGVWGQLCPPRPQPTQFLVPRRLGTSLAPAPSTAGASGTSMPSQPLSVLTGWGAPALLRSQPQGAGLHPG